MKLFITVIMSLLMLSVYGQDATAKYVVETTTKTGVDLQSYTGKVTIAGTEFIGGTSKTGSVWIRKLSAKSGEYYKQYLGTPTSETYNGHTIWTTKKGDKLWYFTVKNGKLSRTYLKSKDNG